MYAEHIEVYIPPCFFTSHFQIAPSDSDIILKHVHSLCVPLEPPRLAQTLRYNTCTHDGTGGNVCVSTGNKTLSNACSLLCFDDNQINNLM